VRKQKRKTHEVQVTHQTCKKCGHNKPAILFAINKAVLTGELGQDHIHQTSRLYCKACTLQTTLEAQRTFRCCSDDCRPEHKVQGLLPGGVS